MEQKEFSRLIFEFLEKHFPEFIPSIKYQDDGSFDVDNRSPSGKFAIWIATYNREITIGLESPNGKTDIHTHISCDEPEDLVDCLKDLAKLINEVRRNELILYLNDEEVYDWIEFDKLLDQEHKKGRIFEKYFWTDN